MSNYRAITPEDTEQTVFDHVAQHLLTQGERAFENDACWYRTPSGLACAVGCLLPDNMEGKEIGPVYTAYLRGALGTILSCYDDVPEIQALGRFKALLQSLQVLHDTTEPGECCQDWRLQLHDLARRHELSTDVLDTPGLG